MAESDQEIRLRISVDDKQAKENIENLRQRMETFKGFAKAFAKDTNDTLEVAFSSLRKVGLEKLNQQLDELKEELKELKKAKVLDKEGIKEVEKQIESVKKKISDLKEVTTKGLSESKKEARDYVRVLQNLAKVKGIKVPTKDIKDQGEALKGTKKAAEEAQGGIQGLISKVTNLGSVGKLVFGSVLGIGAVQAIRQLIDVFREAIHASLEFQKSLFTLEVAIRGLQRVGLDTTIGSWTKQLAKLKKQFPIFSRKEFVDAASLAALMTREFGFTEDQIANLVRLSAILSEITGKDLNEAVRGITFAIGSGYFESLQRAGINISRQVVANEALAQGYEGVYNELEPVIRAQVTYNVIQKNLAAIQEDAGKIIETTAGQVRALNAAWQDFLIVVGSVITDTDEAKRSVEGLALAVRTLTELVEFYSKLELGGAKISVLDALFGPNYSRFLETLPEFNEHLKEFYSWLVKINAQRPREPILDELITSGIQRDLGEVGIGGVTFSEEEFQEIVDATQDLAEEINEIDEEAKEKNHEIWMEWFSDRIEIVDKHNERIADLEQDLADKLADIGIKESRKTADEIANNAFRVAEALRQANFRREDAERKFRERELKSERKFQEKLRQLRENFLLDLEDAVRERDARQIIRLTRQYNLRRTQMIREEKLNKTDRQDAFKEQLRQIEFQRQERLRQLAIEHQRRLDDITRQAERERNQAEIDFERRKDDEDKRFQQDKDRRDARREEQLADVKEDVQERTDAVIEALQKEGDLTNEQLDAIATLYEGTYGPDGRITAALENYHKQLLITEALMKRLQAYTAMYRMTFIPPGAPVGGNFVGGQAEGGTIIARKPTVAIFGEAGPEMAQFTPLNRLGANAPAQIKPMDIDQMTRDGRIRLEMLLSPDLEARIVDNTLGEIADVNFTIERARK